jgi:hypothetical protein
VNLYGRVVEQDGKPKWVDTKVFHSNQLIKNKHNSHSLGYHGYALRYASTGFQ